MENRHERRAPVVIKDASVQPGTVLPSETEVITPSIPSFFAGSLQIAQAVNDFSLQFSRSIIGTADLGGTMTPVARITPVVEVVVSPQSMKDFAVSVTDAIAQYEREFGVIETAFTRRKAADNQP